MTVNNVLTLYSSSATRPLTKAVVVAMAGMILPAINLLYKSIESVTKTSSGTMSSFSSV